MIPHLVADEIRAGPPVTSCAPAACARLEPDSFVGPVIRTVFVVMAVTLRWLSSWAREGPAKPRTGGTTPLFPGRWPAAGAAGPASPLPQRAGQPAPVRPRPCRPGSAGDLAAGHQGHQWWPTAAMTSHFLSLRVRPASRHIPRTAMAASRNAGCKPNDPRRQRNLLRRSGLTPRVWGRHTHPRRTTASIPPPAARWRFR
jgi:hypothetical protein